MAALDVAYAMVVTGRDIALNNAEDIIGPCMSTIPQRISLSGNNVTVIDVLRSIQMESHLQSTNGYVGIRKISEIISSFSSSLKLNLPMSLDISFLR